MSVSPVHTIARYNGPLKMDLAALIQRMEQVDAVVRKLNEAGNTIHKEDGIEDVFVLQGLQLWQLLYTQIDGIDRDTQRFLQLLIDKATSVSLESLEKQGVIAEIGPWAQDRASSVDEINQWLALLRAQLRIFRGDPSGFYSECWRAFPNFVYSDSFPECLATFDGDFADFCSEVAAALISLAEDMPECMKQPTTYECMKAFGAVSGYETSMEGDIKRKDALTFKFVWKEGERKILCEPHIKLHRSARAGDAKYYFHRIYFSSGDHIGLEGKTLIGHIGKHL